MKSKGTKARVDLTALMGAVYFSFHCNYIIIIIIIIIIFIIIIIYGNLLVQRQSETWFNHQ